MKTNNSSYRPIQKPIKYKQFIQQLQNSSRSSNHDHSMLSHRSFRQNNIIRQNQQTLSSKKQQEKRVLKQKTNLMANNLENNSFKLNKPTVNNSNQNKQKQDVLYTFCDAKITQKSVQIAKQTTQTKRQQTDNRKSKPTMDKKYFRTSKQQKNQQKQNINFVNQIINNVQSGFQGKILKTETQLIQNLSSRKNSIQTNQKNILGSNKLASSIKIRNNSSQSLNLSKKVQAVKKVLILSKQSNGNQTATRGNSIQKQQTKNNASQQLTGQKDSKIQNCSSKKKIVSLNINCFKNTNSTKSKIKLSLDKTYENKNNLSLDQKDNTNKIIFKNTNSNRTLNHSLQKMSSLEQSKIQNLHNQNNFLMSGTQLKQLSGFFGKRQSEREEEILKLNRTIEEMKDKEKRLVGQINHLKVQSMHKQVPVGLSTEQKQLQILKKDCTRLTNSYKQVKKLYQMSVQQKQQLQNQLRSLHQQNFDLKQCLQYKKHQISNLQHQIMSLQSTINSLNQKINQKNSFDQDLSGLSTIIKQKIYQYETQIQSLTQQNQKLILIRQKLQNYNMTLKQQIQQKDNLIWQMQQKYKNVYELKKSCRNQMMDYRQNQNKLTKIVKELQSKLKLANIHNQYLTKQLVGLKNQRKAKHNFEQCSPMMVKFGSNNPLANTITTRNSSICYNGKDKFESLMIGHVNQNRNLIENHKDQSHFQ